MPLLLLSAHLSGIDHLLQTLTTLWGFAGQVPLSANVALIDVLRTLIRLEISIYMKINH